MCLLKLARINYLKRPVVASHLQASPSSSSSKPFGFSSLVDFLDVVVLFFGGV